MPQCRCEDMQIPKITISTVNSIACPGVLYAHMSNNHIHIFNNHLIRKKILFVKHTSYMYVR